MNHKGFLTKFFLIIAIIVVAFLGYRFFFVGEEEGAAGLVGLAPVGNSSSRNNPSDQFVTLLSSLRAIDLSDLPRVIAILNGLEDFSTVLEKQTPGRNNPFLPIGAGGARRASTATTTATSTTTTATTSATTTSSNQP